VRPFGLAVAAAFFAGALLPRHPLGVAVPLVAAVVVVAVMASSAVPPSAHSLAFGAISFALAATPALRDAGWVVAIDLVAAFMLASLAVAGGAGAAELAVGSVAALLRLGDVRALASDLEPEPGSLRRAAPAGRGFALGAVVVLPFGVLFWTGDRAFAELGSSVPLPDTSSWPSRTAVFGLVLAAATGLVLAAHRPPGAPRVESQAGFATAEWAIPLALLDLLFLAFVFVQLTVLFGGNDHVLQTAGLTYAEYARQGFAQLLAAAALTLIVVAVAVRCAKGSAILLRALLGILCALTLVVVASALRRLDLYEDAFGFTRLRLAASAAGLWLGGVFCLVLVAGVTRHARWLPRTAVAYSALGVLAFTLANPDGLVADRNIDRWQKTGKLDLGYVGSLSADAVSALVRLPSSLRDQALARQRDRLARPEPWSAANLARRRARRALAGAATT
jgi:hypothetical protein